MHFQVANIDIFPLWPPLVAFVISFFTSMGGVSGAFLLLPFQVSVLGFTSPAVNSTNLIYNIIAIPGGVYRYIREKRMVWPITWVIIAGSFPGLIIGIFLRIEFLPDPRWFKFFVGCVLCFIGLRLFLDIFNFGFLKNSKLSVLEKNFKKTFDSFQKGDSPNNKEPLVINKVGAKKIIFRFYGEEFSFNPIWLFVLAFVVGIIGGAYGIGGGGIIAPFLVSFFALPVYAIAGSALMGTFFSSVFGVIVFYLIAPHYLEAGVRVTPDWLLGIMFGAGGLLGSYLGARAQKFMSARFIRTILASSISFLALKYIVGVFV